MSNMFHRDFNSTRVSAIVSAVVKPFSLLIKAASADCNLQCRYCFYLDRKELYPGTKVHRMSEAVLEQMIRTYMSTDQPQYAFGWQGGEPTLMGLDFFKRVTALQEKYGHAGKVVANGLQTNATLITDEFAEHLARYKFLLGVSLDGPTNVHDHYRKTPDGRGSHAAVMRGIEFLRRRDVEFNILTLVNAVNVRRPKEIYRYLCDKGFLFHQYIECVEFDESGQLMPFAVSGEAWGNFLCTLYDEWIRKDTRRVSIRLFDSILAMMVDRYPNVCQMSTDCRQYFVVEHNGDVYPCDFFVRPELKLGSVMRDAWEALQASKTYAAFGQRKGQHHPRCNECEFLRFCAADCQKNRAGAGIDPSRLSALCNGWRQFYAHALPGFRGLADEIRRERARAENAAQRGSPGDKPGRNDPCPCGSRKKYKHCCGKSA